MSKAGSQRQFTKWILIGLGGLLILGATGFFVVIPDEDLSWIRPDRDRADALQILPAPAFAFHELQVSGPVVRSLRISQRSDDEDGPRLVWSVNGKDVDVGTGFVLPAHLFRRGDVVRARIEAPGPNAPILQAESSIVIANAPPHVKAAYLERPGHRPTEANLHIEASDPDGDLLDYRIQWTIDGEPWPGQYGMRADLSGIERGQKVRAEIVVSDGGQQIEYRTAALDVDNQPPSLEVAAQPEIITNEDGSRMALLSASSRDPDGDAVTIAAVDAPAGVDWDGSRQALVWSVTDGTQPFEVILRADDARGGQAERTITLRR